VDTRLLLIRHGQSVWNAARRWQGHSDAPLSRLGHEQAEEVAQTLAGESLDALYASDLKRAFVTAQFVGAPHGLVPVRDPRLRELDVGAWGGLTRHEISTRWPGALAAFDEGGPEARPEGGETGSAFRARVTGVLDDLADRHRGETLAIVAHGGVLAAVTGEFGHANCAVVRVTWPPLA